ncbi:hypothetical protein VTN77DRAFT_1872 [Rasamsonia byssochlamydoides]|uniref:uncharacterized protein n=1 Tax=Rasamsonia byssochlamydoides TaxID=89139 RepID=UPI003743D387
MESTPAVVQYALFSPSRENSLAVAVENNSPLSQRRLWQDRTRNVASVIATGDLHLAALVLSSTILLCQFLFDYAARYWKKSTRSSSFDSDGRARSYTPISYVVSQIAFAVASFSLSVAAIHQSGSWKRSLLLVYITVLCLTRVLSKVDSFRDRLYRHINILATAATLLSAVQVFLPITIIDSNYRPTTIETALVSCLAATVLIPFIAPRPRRPPKKQPGGDDEVLALDDEKASPEETCSLLSFFWSYEWITYLVLRGCRRDLTVDDLPPLPSYDAPLKWLHAIRKQRQRGGKTFRTLCRLLQRDIKIMVGWAAAVAMVDYVAPTAMFHLLGYLGSPHDAIVHPLLWILLLFVGPITRSLCYQQYIFTATRLLVRVNMSLVQEIYQTALRSHLYDVSIAQTKTNTKTFKTSSEEASKNRQADITTLMSYDVDAIYNSRDIFFVAVSGSISITIAITFLYRMLGWPSLFGVTALFLMTPLPALVSRCVSQMQRSVMRATDARLSKITEYLGSIRTLKYFGWEPAMSEKINALRTVEQQRIWKRNVLTAVITMMGDFLPMVSLLVTFSAVVLFTDTPLEAPVAFTSLSIMEILRSQCVWMSNVIRMSSQGLESLRRLDRFFSSAVEIQRHPVGPPEFQNATFRRTPIADFKLQNLSILFRHKELNVVTGPTGSGKTSLLLSLLGETVLESGAATCPRDVAYVPQTAWLQNDTIRQNILFYSAFDQKRYEAVVDACGLTQDLEQLPAGDLTEVGERGTSLSGGQKQRVSLARAIYSRASTLLLDDIFSALDTHTTTLVYERCFRSGLLAGRTVILVTHLPVALQDAQMVVTLDQGAVSYIRVAQLDSSEVAITVGSEEETTAESSSLELELGKPMPEVAMPSVPAEPQSSQPGRVVEETSAKGRIPRTLAFQYMLLFGGYPYALIAILSAFTVQVAYFSITYWLSIWTEAYARDDGFAHVGFYLSIYAAAVVMYLSLQFLNNLIYQYGGWTAAKKMHSQLVHAILSAPISWFDQNPVGRAINRFGNDTRSMDMVLVEWLRQSMNNGLRLLLRIASIASVMPIFAVPAVIICSIGFVIGEMYTRAQVSIKRLCAVNYSPVFTHFTDTLAGMTVIRARDGMDNMFQKLLADRLAVHSRASEAQYNCNRWVSVRSDLCAASVAAIAGFLAYTQSGSAGLVGFSLSNAIGMSQSILILVRTMNELEVELNSFQRIREYADIESEESQATHNKNASRLPPAHWPATGRVEFHNVTARYHPDGPDVLKNVTFVAAPGERIAIVGRTGSGKSTLGLSLLRFTNIVSGKVTMDGIDISTIPLNRLRTSISLIPQEPVLFSGDIQSNLDPFGQLSETELQSALSACTAIHVGRNNSASGDNQTQDQDASTAMTLSLDTPVAANGENFSQGQRQILGLARAISRRSKVVLLDEATASVDQRTDAHIQRLIRSEFPDSTIIAIAHRLRTIMDYDRVIVMGGGEILEIGSPAELIDRKGLFCDMLRNTGEYDELVALVKKSRAE